MSTDASRDNAVRARPDAAILSSRAGAAPAASTTGHVESHFLKANSPDGTRAIWIKHTTLVPIGSRPAFAELWAVAFAEGGRRKQALKQTFALRDAQFDAHPFRIRVPTGELTDERSFGSLQRGSDRLAWDLAFAGRAPTFRPYPLEVMYRGAFPRSKSLTPNPDARFRGWFDAFGERWELADWRGCQGHNWGNSHAHAYAWTHTSALSHQPHGPAVEGAWMEALTGRVRVGRRLTPWLSVAGIAYGGRLVRFAGPRAMLSRRVSVGLHRYEFELARPGARLRAEFSVGPECMAGLRYQDPDGSELACLNSKLAHGKLTLDDGDRQLELYTHQAALEIGTREPAHGIPLLA